MDFNMLSIFLLASAITLTALALYMLYRRRNAKRRRDEKARIQNERKAELQRRQHEVALLDARREASLPSPLSPQDGEEQESTLIMILSPSPIDTPTAQRLSDALASRGFQWVNALDIADYLSPTTRLEVKDDGARLFFRKADEVFSVLVPSLDAIDETLAQRIKWFLYDCGEPRFNSSGENIRYSRRPLPAPDYSKYGPDTSPMKPTPRYDADANFDEETLEIAREIRDRIEILKAKGLADIVLHDLLSDVIPPLSRLVITTDGRVLLVDYKKEVKMTLLPKMVLILFLRHPEGILFKDLSSYRDEMLKIYNALSPENDPIQVEQSVQRLTTPTDNSINEKCARIREAFLKVVDDSIAANYYVRGARALPKSISLDRNLLTCELSI